MMDYQFKIYSREQFPILEKAWKILAQGEHMTYFQSYEWNKMLLTKYPEDNYFFSIVIVAILSKETFLMLAPLCIVKHPYKYLTSAGIYMIGNIGWSDYVDFIYREFDTPIVDFMFANIKRNYGLSTFYINSLRDDSPLFTYFQEKKLFSLTSTEDCVMLSIPYSIEVYTKSLKKSTKQNIRTAINRMIRDNINYRFTYDDKSVDRNECYNLYQERCRLKQRRIALSHITKLKRRIKQWLRFPIEEYHPLFDDVSSKVMSIYNGNELMAFFNYGLDAKHQTIVVMAAGVNEKYVKYSPGIVLMYDYILSKIKSGYPLVVDFTRGNSTYKYVLGGTTTWRVNNIIYKIG